MYKISKMYKKVLIFGIFLFIVACSEDITEKHRISEKNDMLWNDFIVKLVNKSLWTDKYAYNAGHLMMIPLHYAFLTNDKDKIKDFELLFNNFNKEGYVPSGHLVSVHWMYLVSRYLALKTEFNYPDFPFSQSDKELLEKVRDFAFSKYKNDSHWQWGGKAFQGVAGRLDYLSEEREYPYSYYEAVRDDELFILAIASDIYYIYENLQIKNTPQIQLALQEAVDDMVDVFIKRGVITEQGGYIFQPGVWRDHPEFKYAGHNKLEPDLREKKVNDVAEDSSHSHRMPLWLISLYNAVSTTDKEKINNIRYALSKQFNDVVVAKNVDVCDGKGFFLNNYMDGRNGIYRYKYYQDTQGKEHILGYPPFGLTSIMKFSWYPFLPNSEKIFKKYLDSYPLTNCVRKVYLGASYTKPKPEEMDKYLYDDAVFLDNGYAEFWAFMSYFISKNYQLDTP